jgi:ketosteroid isomerase-like protein
MPYIFEIEVPLGAEQRKSLLPFITIFVFPTSGTQSCETEIHGGLMQKMILLAGIIIATLAVSAFGQNADAAHTAIRKVLEEQQAAWNRRDLEAFMAGYWNSPELTFFSGAHESKGWQAALDRYKKNYQGAGHEMGKLEFANLRIEMLGSEAAFVRGEFHLTMSDGKTPHGLFTLVFRKMPEGWKIIHDHSAAE